ncbi:MAG: radical SAM family heme chaperone HemW [Balneolales bacterium]|nr:radical SAM family heme chaperone HemW [Balneolales bacterium]
MSGIYIHIPFCRQACTYCDFYFETSLKHRAGFVPQLLREIAHTQAQFPETTAEPVKTLYFGGGTPSRLTTPEIAEIIARIRQGWTLEPGAEITLEMNPDDVHSGRLAELRQAGITRVSMGVQTFDEARLRFMNRAHTRGEALRALEALAGAGLPSWTADLIYGNPGQTRDELQADLETLLQFQPPHVSAYSLTVEENTKLYRMVKKQLVQPPDDEEVAEQMQLVTDTLGAAGIARYEVSNYARPGHESRHNGAYWRHENYLGFGPGAHGFWWQPGGQGAERTQNAPRLRTYMDADPGIAFHRTQTDSYDLAALGEERLLLGLRTRSGVSREELLSRYGCGLTEAQLSTAAKFTAQDLLDDVAQTGLLRLTQKGLLFANRIGLELVSVK